MTPNLPKQPPEAIAEDVLAAARKAVVSVNPDERVLIMSGHYDDWDTVQSAVAAIMAERERCATIADEHAVASISGVPDPVAALRLAARSIVAAIRAGA